MVTETRAPLQPENPTDENSDIGARSLSSRRRRVKSDENLVEKDSESASDFEEQNSSHDSVLKRFKKKSKTPSNP